MTQPISALLGEDRRFPPSPAFRAQANATEALYAEAERDRLAFWAKQAEQLTWFRPWDQVLDWAPPHARWFVGGKLNACYNCVDRHALGDRATKAAIVWEGEPGEQRTITYGDLLTQVSQFAAVLAGLGVRKGDRVAVYLPVIPESIVAMMACARLGAVHSVVFGGFSSEALRDRINDCEAKVLITADGGYRRGAVAPMRRTAEEALAGSPSVEKVLVIRRVGDPELVADTWQEGRDVWYEPDQPVTEVLCAEMDAEDPLYILYTSGSTGKPKGVLHSTGGYLTQVAATHKYVFDSKEEDVYWCTADVAWVTAHSYLVYGPLANGTTILLYEGAPDWPHRGRMWEIIERYGATILYTAPTLIRTFMKWGDDWLTKYNLSSLRLLGSVGEPINPEAWVWYHAKVGGGRCPVVDTWWQTETGGILIAALPGAVDGKPGSATRPFPGIEAEVVDEAGEPVAPNQGGTLVIKSPWPAMLRTIWGDDKRYVSTYFSQHGERTYVAGDGARRDEDGYFWLLGRLDDVVNVSGHRIGTAEVESALVSHAAVAEAAVIGRAHEVKGQAISAFVTLKEGVAPTAELRQELRQHVAAKIGALARPEDLYFAADLPKNRSGKILRRLLRDIAEGRALGDTTTLVDPTVVTSLQAAYAEQGAAD